MFGLVAVSGCGGGGSAGAVTTPSTSSPVTINSFTVAGTSASVNGVAPISPGVNGGAFNISWNVTGNNTYTLKILLSTDSVYSDVTDIQIVPGGCGKTSNVDTCHTNGTLNCTFNNSNSMVCSYGYGSWSPVDLTAFLGGTGIPANLHFVMKACNPLGDSCPTTSAPIQIQ